ncbi:MBL fold metallo-hydrolase [Halomonas sp. CS7]|uniref:MBL fold metallo-hydrolase n=1 Tax=Halomonas pelophila TaxID=3151122 RepID=A0ABV1N602_9GAMM
MTVSDVQRTHRKRREREALEYPFVTPAALGEVETVAEGVLWARVPMPMSLDHINVYLLRDHDGWWLVDTGLNTARGREVWERLAAERLEGLPFKALICTHFHHDHIGLAHWLMERFGLPLYMSHGEYFSMRALASAQAPPLPEDQRHFYERAGMPADDIDAMFAAFRHFAHSPPHPEAFHRLRDDDRLSIGGRDWRVIIGEGHSPEHVCLYAPEDRLLIAGDQLLPEISSNVMVSNIEPEADPLGGWLASLDRLATLAPDTLVLPSHGPVFRQLPERVRQLQEHHERQFVLIRELAERSPGFTAFDAMCRLFPRALPPTEKLLALGEALAHLALLRRRGELVRRPGRDVDGFYPATGPGSGD